VIIKNDKNKITKLIICSNYTWLNEMKSKSEIVGGVGRIKNAADPINSPNFVLCMMKTLENLFITLKGI
jgi:hypothetical protein